MYIHYKATFDDWIQIQCRAHVITIAQIWL